MKGNEAERARRPWILDSLAVYQLSMGLILAPLETAALKYGLFCIT